MSLEVRCSAVDSAGGRGYSAPFQAEIDKNDPPVIVNSADFPDIVMTHGDAVSVPQAVAGADPEGDRTYVTQQTKGDLSSLPPGNYSSTIKACDVYDACTAISQTITVKAPLPPNSSPRLQGPAALDVGLGATVDFTATHACIDSEDGAIPFTPTSFTAPNAPGSTTVTLSCTDSDGAGTSLEVSLLYLCPAGSYWDEETSQCQSI